MLLHELKKHMEVCKLCPELSDRKNLVFGQIPERQPLLAVIGEASGETEDELGEPFCGKAGEKLNNILRYVDVPREETLILNAILCRPPENRTPTFEEIINCRWRLLTQLYIVKPEIVVLMGKTALQSLWGEEIKEPLKFYFTSDFRCSSIEDYQFKYLVTYHPSFHLRSPEKSYKESLPHWTLVKNYIQTLKERNLWIDSLL